MSYLASEPRLLDFMFRISFTELSGSEQDRYAPSRGAVAVVSEAVEEEVPVRRGGYFVLPELPLAYEQDGTIMFREQSRKRKLNIAYAVRVASGNRLSYADFGKAMAEFQAMQKRIPFYSLKLMSVKHGNAIGIKACFREPGGTVTVGGKALGAAAGGTCTIVKFDPEKVDTGELIEFDGPLDILTLAADEGENS